jgi:hypothetical protein
MISANQKGDTGEMLFMAECVLRGLSVSVPFGHNNIYDVVVEGFSGKLYKVQVKMASGIDKNGTGYRFHGCRHGVDAFAFLCADKWFILPAKLVNFKTMRVYEKKHEKYFGKFDIFV